MGEEFPLPENEIDLSVTTSVTTHRGCEIRAVVTDCDAARFIIGGAAEPVDITFDSKSLRDLLRLAQRSVADLDRRRAEEASGLPVRDFTYLSARDSP